MKNLYPFDQRTRVYIGAPQPWPLDPVATDNAGEPIYAQLSDPPQSAADAPPEIPVGMLARRLNDDSGWALLADTLGDWWDANGQQVRVDSLDVDVSELTRTPPPNETCSLSGGTWVIDPVKVESAKRFAIDGSVVSGMAEAARQIAVLQDAVDLGMATQAESTAYTEWRRYRVLLSRVNSDPAYPNVTLPEQPPKVVP